MSRKQTGGRPGETARVAANASSDLGLDVAGARDRLITWSRLRPLVDQRIFAGDLRVQSRQLLGCRIVRLVEQRSERHEAIPAGQSLPELARYSAPLSTVALEVPADFQPRTWQLLQDGSERLDPCTAGCRGGRKRCRQCESGWSACSSCGGTGRRWVTNIVDDRHVQQEERCPYCDLGRTRCQVCGGKGWQRCQLCQGAGALITFTRGRIDHQPTVARYKEPLPKPINADRLKDDDWLVLETRTSRPAAELIPSQLKRLFGDEIGRPASGEILRRVEVLALADTLVTLPDQPQATVHIVGLAHRVFATGVRSKPRVIAMVIAVTVLVVIALILVSAQLR